MTSDIPCEITKITLEGACALLILAIAWKIYKMRIATESECCQEHFRLRTINRGGSDTDLEMRERVGSDEPGV